MEISIFWNIFFISAFSQGFFVAFILFSQFVRTKHLSQLLLGSFIFSFSYILANNTVYWNQKFPDFPHFLFTTVGVIFLLAPLFYLYCKTFINGSFGKKHLLHFLPFIFTMAVYFPFYSLSGPEKLELISGIVKGEIKGGFYTAFANIHKWLLSFQLIFYAGLIYYELNEYIKKQADAIDKHKINQIEWLKFLNGLFLLYGLLMLFYYILVTVQVGGIEKDYWISFVMCIAIYSISYVGMMNPDLLKGEKFLERIQSIKYNKTRLQDDHLKELISKLETFMQSEKIFTEPDVNLDHVAQKMDVPKHYISQALSLQLDKTFPEYINQHRVEYACQMLGSFSGKNNIKTVMYASGFNNRASFNNNFKKIKGMTATEYLKSIKADSNMDNRKES